MAKRFSDTDKWKKPFIRSLQAPYKLFWLYILDDCDHAGIWQVDIEIANIKLGENINLETALSQFGDKIIVFDNGEKWFIKDFIDFQYGELNPKNRVHESVLSILKKYKLLNNKGLVSPMGEAKDKDKEQFTDKCKDKIEGDEVFFEMFGDRIPVTPLEYCMINYQTYIESMIMNFGKSKVTMERFKDNFNLNHPSGSIFSDDKHLRNTIRSSIKILADMPIVEKYTPFIEPAKNKW